MRSRKPEVYSHPHFAPQRILMDNHRMENCRPQVNIISPIVLEATIVETWRQFVRIGIIQSQIGSTTKLGSGSGGILTRRKLNGSSTLPTTTTRVVGTPQIVFTNLILIIHEHKITFIIKWVAFVWVVMCFGVKHGPPKGYYQIFM